MTDYPIYDVAGELASTFGAEWTALSRGDRDLIVRDCTEDGDIPDMRDYKRSIGPGNLQAYAEVMRVRFGR